MIEPPTCELCGDQTRMVKKLFEKDCNRCGVLLRGKVFHCKQCAKRADGCKPGSKGELATFEVCSKLDACLQRMRKNNMDEERKMQKKLVKKRKRESDARAPPPPPLESYSNI